MCALHVYCYLTVVSQISFYGLVDVPRYEGCHGQLPIWIDTTYMCSNSGLLKYAFNLSFALGIVVDILVVFFLTYELLKAKSHAQ